MMSPFWGIYGLHPVRRRRLLAPAARVFVTAAARPIFAGARGARAASTTRSVTFPRVSFVAGGKPGFPLVDPELHSDGVPEQGVVLPLEAFAGIAREHSSPRLADEICDRGVARVVFFAAETRDDGVSDALRVIERRQATFDPSARLRPAPPRAAPLRSRRLSARAP